MAGLVLAIHAFLAAELQDVDAPHKAGHDGGEAVAAKPAALNPP
jgi:hypothetical protein